MPGRLPTLAMSGIWTAAIFLLCGLRRHGAPLILDRDMRHGVDELPQEVDLRTLHQARHHDGEADAHGHAGHAHEGLPHPGADVGPCDAEEEVSRRLPAVADHVATRVIDDGVDVGGHGCGNHRIVGICRRSGGGRGDHGSFGRVRRADRPVRSGAAGSAALVRLLSMRTLAPSARSLRAGESTVVPLRYVADDLGVAAAADADGHGHASDLAVIDRLNRIARDRPRPVRRWPPASRGR